MVQRDNGNLDGHKCRFEAALSELGLLDDFTTMKILFTPSVDTSEHSETWLFKYSHWKKIIMVCLESNVFGSSKLTLDVKLLTDVCVWRGRRFDQFTPIIAKMTSEGLLHHMQASRPTWTVLLEYLLGLFSKKEENILRNQKMIDCLVGSIDAEWETSSLLGYDCIISKSKLVSDFSRSYNVDINDSHILVDELVGRGVFVAHSDWLVHHHLMAKSGYSHSLFAAQVKLRIALKIHENSIRNLESTGTTSTQIVVLVQRAVLIETMMMKIDMLCQTKQLADALSLASEAIENIQLECVSRGPDKVTDVMAKVSADVELLRLESSGHIDIAGEHTVQARGCTKSARSEPEGEKAEFNGGTVHKSEATDVKELKDEEAIVA